MSLISSKNQQQHESQTHKVFITHDVGIFTAYNLVIESLKSETANDLTLLYFTIHDKLSILYKSELELLERRFNGRLLAYFVDSNQSCGDDYNNLSHELFEVVINSNTKPKIMFYLIGNEHFIDTTNHYLHFLGVDSSEIIHKSIILQ